MSLNYSDFSAPQVNTTTDTYANSSSTNDSQKVSSEVAINQRISKLSTNFCSFDEEQKTDLTKQNRRYHPYVRADKDVSKRNKEKQTLASSESPRTSTTEMLSFNLDDSILDKTQTIKNTNNSKHTNPIPYQSVSNEEFVKRFGENCFDIMVNESKFARINVKGKLSKPLMTSGVAACLGLLSKSFDAEGNLILAGVGHFDSLVCIPYAKDDADTLINLFLNKSYNSRKNAKIGVVHRVEIFAFGMYGSKFFEPIGQRILNDSKVETKIYSLINPWKITNQTRSDSDDYAMEVYISEIGFALSAGIAKSGNVYVTDESNESPASDGFFHFDEKKFTKWKAEDNGKCFKKIRSDNAGVTEEKTEESKVPESYSESNPVSDPHTMIQNLMSILKSQKSNAETIDILIDTLNKQRTSTNDKLTTSLIAALNSQKKV